MPILTKINGQLVEEETSLADRVKAAGTTTPTSPAGAVSIGASPDAAKMVGTPAQKQNAVTQTVKKEETLQGVSRLSQPRQQATQQETAATQLSNTFSKLGSMGTRVQALVDQRLQGVAQAGNAQATVKGSGLNGALGIDDGQAAAQAADPNSTLSKAKAALQTLSQTPTGPAAELALQTLANLGIQQETARGLLDTSAAAIGQQAANATQDTVTASQLDVSQLGFSNLAEMAATLGVPEEQLANANVATIQQLARDAQQRELATVDTLKAKLAATPVGSAQHSMLMQQLADMGQVGTTGSEAQAQEAVQKLNTADQVTVGGQTMSVENMLKDENLSNLIAQYVQSDPATRDTILPADKFGDLRTWIDNNQQSLGVLANDLQQTTKQFGTTQEQWDDLANTAGVPITEDVMAALIPDWNRDTVVTSEQLAAAKDALTNSSIGQLANVPGGKEILAKVNADNVAELKDMTADEIADAYDAAKLANTYEYQKLLGLDGPVDFLTDPALRAKAAEMKPIIDLMKNAGVSEKWLNDKDFTKLTPEQMKSLAENPEQYEDFRQYQDTQKKLASASTPAEIFSVIFGGTVGDKEIAGVNDELQNLKTWVKLGVPGAAEKMKQITDTLDADGDGDVDGDDATLLKDRVAKGIVDGGDVQSIFDGGDFSKLFKPADSEVLTGRFNPNDNTLLSLKEFMADGQITKEELAELDDLSLADIVSGKYGDLGGGVVDTAKSLSAGKEAAAVQQEFARLQGPLNRIFGKDVSYNTDGGVIVNTSDPSRLLDIYSQLMTIDGQGPASTKSIQLMQKEILNQLRGKVNKSKRDQETAKNAAATGLKRANALADIMSKNPQAFYVLSPAMRLAKYGVENMPTGTSAMAVANAEIKKHAAKLKSAEDSLQLFLTKFKDFT